MTTDQRLTLLVTFIGILVIPSIVLSARAIVKWTKVEMRLDSLVTDVRKLVEDKDKVHREMITQMREDRSVTDRRLRWLEEHIWSRGQKQ